MALALGVSTHRLVHHFGTKAELLDAALRRALEIQEDVQGQWLLAEPGMSLPDLLRRWWHWCLESNENLALVRLGIEAVSMEAAVTGLGFDIRERQIGVWRANIEGRLRSSGMSAHDAAVEASISKAVFTGTVMDLLASGDTVRISEALEQYLAALDTRIAAAALV